MLTRPQPYEALTAEAKTHEAEAKTHKAKVRFFGLEARPQGLTSLIVSSKFLAWNIFL